MLDEGLSLKPKQVRCVADRPLVGENSTTAVEVLWSSPVAEASAPNCRTELDSDLISEPGNSVGGRYNIYFMFKTWLVMLCVYENESVYKKNHFVTLFVTVYKLIQSYFFNF